MDNITYRGLNFTIIQSLGWEREVIYDPSNTTYECTRVRGSVILSYNPGATSFAPQAPNSPVQPFVLAGSKPPETDMAIRRWMEEPRGDLLVQSGTTKWLSVIASDVRNGPFPKVNTISQIPGERLWKIHWEVETYINEYKNLEGTAYPPLFLSNRWYAVDDVNWQHLRTRIYQGTCTVRGDILQSLPFPQYYVDYFRNEFAGFTVPLGFQREKVHVSITPDGNTAHYLVVDTEQLFNKDRFCPAVRIEVMQTDAVHVGPLTGATLIATGASGFIQDIRGALNGNGPGSTSFEQSYAPIRNYLSKFRKNVIVRAWGNYLTARGTLLAYCLAVLQNRMNIIVQSLGNANSPQNRIFVTTSTNELVVSQDTSNMVTVNQTVQWGPDAVGNIVGGAIGSAVTLFASNNLPQPQGLFDASIRQDPNIVGPAGGAIRQDLRTQNPPFPASAGTRGTAAVGQAGIGPGLTTAPLQILVTQALEGFDSPPNDVSTLPV